MAQSTLARVFSSRTSKLLRTDCLKYVRKQTNSAAAKPAQEHSPIEKILIANRGEIACRVMQSARRMGIRSVACYSDADANSMHVSMADEAHYIGPSPATESYLCMNKIIDVAKRSGAQAIHPGYGFLSEKPEFANLCEEKGITFIGPPSSAIRDMGIKSTSKEIMGKAGVPLIQGYHGDNQSDEFLAEQADKIGYPVMLKAVRGGGGKGMRVANDASEFMAALNSARNESLKAFDDDKMLIEQLIERPRHVEVQVFADSYGNTVYLFERDCSVQRRHQKIIEEAPAPGMTEEMRQEIGEAAVRAAKAVGYVGAGTVEFILDARGNFYFMEMNTRLQVEHPVTEMISGVDLVELQIRAAAGEVLPFTQQDLVLNGHSFEARIYAEDPDSNFIPGTGLLKYLSVPDQDPTIRVETGVRQGDEVSQFYDPMIAKLVVWDRDRQTALRKLVNKLKQYHIVGLKTNIPFLLSLATHESFITADVHTGFIEEHYASLFPPKAPLTRGQLAQAAFALSLSKSASLDKRMNEVRGYQVNVTGGSKLALTHQGKDTEVTLLHEKDGSATIKVGDEDFSCRGHLSDDGTLHINVDGRQEKINCFVQHGSVHMFADEGAYCVEQQRPKFILEASDKQLPDGAVAPMTGSILQLEDPISHVAFADDITGSGKIENLIRWRLKLVELGPKFGYFPNAANSYLIVKEVHKDRADGVFVNTRAKITSSGKRHLGAVIGSREYKNEFMEQLVGSWSAELSVLLEIAQIQPQASNSAYIKGFKHKFNYALRTITDIEHHLAAIEDTLRNQFIPAITGGNVCSDEERKMLALSVKFGGLGKDDVCNSAQFELEASIKVTKRFVENIKVQNTEVVDDVIERKRTKTEIKWIRDHQRKTQHDVSVSKMTEKDKSHNKIVIDASSNWLIALPLEEFNFNLNKMEFWDAIRLRCRARKGATSSSDTMSFATSKLLSGVCNDIELEPQLIRLS